MRYVSSRGQAPALAFDDVVLAGPAPDGGLYLPESWPRISASDLAGFAGLSYAEIAQRVMTPFLGGAIAAEDFAAMVADTYAGFDHAAVAPLRQLGPEFWLLELFHGPTLAFKDYALQLLGRLFDHVLSRRGERITVVGATSGDTGAAAIEACRDRAAVEIFILHPEGRISEVQRRQMTTVAADNVHNIAIDGSFDDCQDLVKAMFADSEFRAALGLASINSINWARVMAQTVYYFAAATALGAPGRAVAFAVPTGNFGDVYAGYVAREMGLPIAQLAIGTNRNDALARFLADGRLDTGEVHPSLSPAMDIQVPSNLERLLFDLYGRDGQALAADMEKFRADGALRVDSARIDPIRGVMSAHRLGDDETLAEIGRVYGETGMLIDPHTAVGVGAAIALRRDPAVPMVALATAHPAKFADTVRRATGQHAPLPDRLADLLDRPERLTHLAKELAVVKTHIRATAEMGRAA